MRSELKDFFERISLNAQFLLWSLVLLVASLVLLGWWVGKEIETGVINRTGAEKALYVNSFIHPILENYVPENGLRPQDVVLLDSLVHNSPLGDNIVSIKIWDLKGRVIYSTFPSITGRTYQVNPYLARAMDGQVVALISDLSRPEDQLERQHWKELLETFSPVTRSSTTQETAVVEFYQTLEGLNAEITRVQQSTWLVLGACTLIIYLVQAFFVQRASDTIRRQKIELKDKVDRLTELLKQNAELHERVRRASSRSAAMNERVLRRISAEMHDGPAQDLGYALLRLDRIQDGPGLKEIQASLQHALREIRAISSGMGLPELDSLSLPETLERVVRAHERRTGTQVAYQYQGPDEKGSLSTRIAVYRLVQEALNNSYRHADGKGQQVRAACERGEPGGPLELCVEVADEGPGFDFQQKIDQDIHLGLSGIRERVHSLGGEFRIESAPGRGVLIRARIPLEPEGRLDE